MFKHSNKKLVFLLCLLAASASASSQSMVLSSGAPPFIIAPAPDWSDLFLRHSGWFGGDGIYSIPLEGDSTLLLFSDTMISDSTGGVRKTMIHNSVALLKGHVPDKNNLRFFWDSSLTGRPQTIFNPSTPSSSPGDYYWLGAGVFNPTKKAVYIFAYKMRNLDTHNDWSFTRTATNLIVIPAGSQPPFKNHRQLETPLSFQGATDDDKGTFGAGVLPTDDYLYVYGIRGKNKGLIIARVRPDSIEAFSQWRYWDGATWTGNIQQARPVVEGVSDELSVSRRPDGSYILVFQQMGMSPNIAMRSSPTPWGPFGDAVQLWECTEPRDHKNYYAYNAKAHPALSTPDELLISYNVNAFDFLNELAKDPTLYRPRFLKLRLAN